VDGLRVLVLDEATFDEYPATNPVGWAPEATDAAYVIYTPGSTDRPKGVVVEHGSLAAYLGWSMVGYPDAAGVALVHSPVASDLTVTVLYTPLVVGGCVHLAALDSAARPSKPTWLKATPSHLPLLTELPRQFSPSGQLIVAGEALHGEHLTEWRSRNPGVSIVNSYGPTEITVSCAEYRIAPGDAVPAGPVPIGRPFEHVQMYVLDANLAPVPPGVAGELYISGAGLARGYLNRPGLTAERFVANPFHAGRRMYRTGDLVRWSTDGNLMIVDASELRVHVADAPAEVALTPDGKLDRATLPEPDVPVVAGRAPRTERERVLCELFADVLGLPEVGIDDGFFDLGGHSLLATKVLGRIAKTFGTRLGIRALLETPTVAGLAAALHTLADSNSLTTLLPLRTTGSRPPLFCVHPAAGISWVYSGLLSRISDRPVYGLQSRGLSEPGHQADVEEMAADYLAEIRKVQPSGPYHLLGWSFGGVVAHTIAAALRAEGEQVAFLGLMDAYPADARGEQPAPPTDEQALDAVLESLGIREWKRSPLADLGEAGTAAMARVFAANVAAAVRFTPARFDGDVLFFKATAGRPQDLLEPKDAWRRFVAGEIDERLIDCAHGEMTKPQPLAEIATAVARAIDGSPK
jgi:thioesterase domain-containing protein